MKKFVSEIKNPEVFTKSLHALGISPSKRVCYFDIETTGLSRRSSFIYMIGAVAADSAGLPQVYQWLSEGFADEKQLVEEFIDFLKDFELLIHFNGKTFDVPFVAEKCRKYDIPDIISGMEGIDLLAQMRPYKKIFGLPNLQQKTLEQFAGLNRTDTFSGGDLIPVYSQYTGLATLVRLKPDNEEYAKQYKSLEYLLLLHNYDDLCGMPQLGLMLGFHRLTDIFSYETVETEAFEDFLSISGILSVEGMPSFSISGFGGISFSVRENRYKVTVPVIRGEILKYFFENYKDYYYLPEEDTAIHRSVAEFVDKDHRINATRKNCYTNHSGDFAVCPAGCGLMQLRKSYEDKLCYTPLSSDFTEDREKLLIYVAALADSLFRTGKK